MASLMLVNPRKRRKSTRKKTRRRTGTSVARRRVTRRRRNPIARGGDFMGQIQNAAIGAGGALAVDVAMAKLPIPANLKAGPMLPAVKGAVAIGLGMLVAKFGKKKALGKTLAEGGLTVALHDVAKPMLSNVIPGGLSGYDDELMGYDLMGTDDFDLMGNSLFESDVDDFGISGYDMDDDDDLSGAEEFEDEFND